MLICVLIKQTNYEEVILLRLRCFHISSTFNRVEGDNAYFQSGGDISISARGDEEDLAKWHTFLDITNVNFSNQVNFKNISKNQWIFFEKKKRLLPMKSIIIMLLKCSIGYKLAIRSKIPIHQTSYFCHANNSLGEAVKELKV